jgi:hypothetical protein
MKKFLLLYMSKMSPEEMMKNAQPDSMKPWMTWFEAHKEAIVEMGTPTGNEMNVTKMGSSKPSTFIGGYTIIQAEDADAVKVLLSDHPAYMMEGNSIEVLELLPTPGM